MISYFPDLNVWLALADSRNAHRKQTWNWFRGLPPDASIHFCRYTQIGLLRHLSNEAVMGSEMLTIQQAWKAYDGWTADARIALHQEPGGLDLLFRDMTMAFARQRATKMVGDCYLLAYAGACGSTLVTFDKGLLELARKRGYAISPA